MPSEIRPVIALAAVLLLGSSLLWAAERMSNGPNATEARPAPAGGAGQRQREGSTLVDVVGYFKLTSDRATFFPADSEQRFQGLENLNLERVSLLVSENPDRLDWIVSGTVTEYRGANYLLVTKAILKNKLHAPAR
jgi:hypothetical protein